MSRLLVLGDLHCDRRHLRNLVERAVDEHCDALVSLGDFCYRRGAHRLLFAEDASYRSSPVREPFRGHDAIREYWRRGAGAQRDTRVRMGRPFFDGDRVPVEWWATITPSASHRVAEKIGITSGA